MKKNLGFTLIELLVVVSIISLLSSIILAGIQDARRKGEMTRFEQEILQLRTAVELYRSENNGAYPPSLSDRGNANDLVAELESEGLYGTDTIEIPSFVDTFLIYSSTETSFYTSCGSGDPGSDKWVISFYTTESSNFPILYANAPGFPDNPVDDHYCIQM